MLGCPFLGALLNNILKGDAGAWRRELHTRHQQGMVASVVSLDWNFQLAKHVRVGRGKQSHQAACLAGDSNQCLWFWYVAQGESYKEGVANAVPVLAYVDSLTSAEKLVLSYMYTVALVRCDLFHMMQRITKQLADIPIKGGASTACPAASHSEPAGAMEEIDRRFIADKVEAGGDQEDAEAQLVDKPAAWYRSQMNTPVPDGLTLAENLLQWVKTWLVKLDQPTSIPLATIKAVSATVLQIQAALKQAFSDPPLPQHPRGGKGEPLTSLSLPIPQPPGARGVPGCALPEAPTQLSA